MNESHLEPFKEQGFFSAALPLSQGVLSAFSAEGAESSKHEWRRRHHRQTARALSDGVRACDSEINSWACPLQMNSLDLM